MVGDRVVQDKTSLPDLVAYVQSMTPRQPGVSVLTQPLRFGLDYEAVQFVADRCPQLRALDFQPDSQQCDWTRYFHDASRVVIRVSEAGSHTRVEFRPQNGTGAELKGAFLDFVAAIPDCTVYYPWHGEKK